MVLSVCVPTAQRRLPRSVRPAALLALLAAALSVQAQPAAKANKPDPLDANSSVPPLTYESSFSQYRRLGDEKPLSWREANDTVSRIGGWRVYAREAQQPGTAASAVPAPSAKPGQPTPAAKPTPDPAGHGGHKTP